MFSLGTGTGIEFWTLPTSELESEPGCRTGQYIRTGIGIEKVGTGNVCHTEVLAFTFWYGAEAITTSKHVKQHRKKKISVMKFRALNNLGEADFQALSVLNVVASIVDMVVGDLASMNALN